MHTRAQTQSCAREAADTVLRVRAECDSAVRQARIDADGVVAAADARVAKVCVRVCILTRVRVRSA
jgi:hypothetical protein